MTERLPIFSEPETPQRMTRESPFSYQCNRCNRCCQNQRIRVNPYETARLAQAKGISTTEFLSRYTTENATALSRDEEGYCVFLTKEGCGVHADRPIVCRIYPLGRHLSFSHEEHFTLLTPHAESEGVYGKDETVATFLTAQGSDTFVSALDRYIVFLNELSRVLGEKHQLQENREILKEWMEGAVPGGAGVRLIDMDLAVAEYCDLHRIPFPADLNEKFDLHLKYLEDLTSTLRLSAELGS